MIPSPMRLSLPLLIFLLSTAMAALGHAAVSPGSADPDAAFAEANEKFEAGDTSSAADSYEALAREGLCSPELFYNLGAAKHRLGQSGEGILWMRRALHLEPGMPEAAQSLAFLRTHLGFFEFAQGRFDRFLAGSPPQAGLWTYSLLLWAGALAIAAAVVLPRFRPNRSTLVVLGSICLIASFVAWRIERYREGRLAIENFATVTGSGISAYTAPAPDAKAVVELPPGSEIRLLRRSGSWTYAEIPGDLRGWIRSEAAVPVWPVETD